MPDHEFEVTSDEPLFSDDDPLTISVPQATGKPRKFRCLDRANPPLERPGMNPEGTPIIYMINALASQVVEEERDEFRAVMVQAVEENRILYGELNNIAAWIGDQRRAAEAGTLSRSVKRPTRARPRSTPS